MALATRWRAEKAVAGVRTLLEKYGYVALRSKGFATAEAEKAQCT
jgi:hypothetical protein